MTKKKILYTLLFILVLVVLCYATFTFHKLRDRQSASVQIPDYVKHELIDETMGETPEEIAERDKLRRIYIDSVKANLIGQLDNTYIVDSKGNKTPLKKK